MALIKTTTPALARHENSFLPLINTLWPEIVSRLDDPEPYVVATALDIIAILCQYAGDFMRSRIQRLWPALVEQHQKTVKEIVQVIMPAKAPRSQEQNSSAMVPAPTRLKQALIRMQSAPADYSDTTTRLLWQSLVKVITSILQYVPLTPEMFDDALEMLEPVLEEEEDVRSALEAENPDAVWLTRIRNGSEVLPEMPSVPAQSNWSFVEVSG